MKDIDPIETQEWLDAFKSVLDYDGADRGHYLVKALIDFAYKQGKGFPLFSTTPYINTIPADQEPEYPGDLTLEEKLLAYLRWNAMAMVVRGGKRAAELGGHIASYASSAILYEVGCHHFFHTQSDKHGGDMVFVQGHSSPGIYARAYLEGRFSDAQLDHFREEVEVDGIASYPHPWLMPDFWQFPTVSMGLGPIQAIYQARFLKYLHNRGLVDTAGRHVWAFCGDGEMDEPESLGAAHIARRERLDNLIFVVNCNLQRLDGPVRGNGKVIQDLEGSFRGAGWHVIKVVWDSGWERLLNSPQRDLLIKLMEETVDGDFQNFKAKDGKHGREKFFGKYPELAALVADWSDEEIEALNYGGHDHKKVYAAYKEAVEHTGTPVAILAKTVKGYGMGKVGQGQNTTHQQKKLTPEQIQDFKERFQLPISEEEVAKIPYYRPDDNAPEIKYLKAQREKLGGAFPQRRQQSESLQVPGLDAFQSILADSGDREISTTMALVRIMSTLLKDKNLKQRIVPIIPDECRTFGMEGMFRQFGIYNVDGQLYTPVDSEQLMYYREDTKGQLFNEGLTEAGAFSCWMAAGTSYSNNNFPMIPFYIYYSMFGFQRIGDLAWAAGDMRTRGFLCGGTAGRTTLAGEGLQHQDGHSHIMAGTIPNCLAYDPTYAYELAVIVQDGLRRMYQEQEDIYYYIAVMNENYHHPAMPEGAEEGIIKGMYKLQQPAATKDLHVQLLGSGTILREVIAAAEILEKQFNVSADIWSATSFNELTREARDIERWNRLHPGDPAKQSYVSQCLQGAKGPVVAATDYIMAYADQIRPYVSQRYVVLGTDGFGRSDTRKQLRHFFEVDAKSIVYATLKALADDGQLPLDNVIAAQQTLGINPDKPNPMTV